jgi:predicted metal-dependent peptidase
MLMIGKTLTPQQRVQKAVVDLMRNEDHMAIAPVLMIGSKKVCADTPTAYTDGINEVYGEKFIDGLNEAELRFLILHETYHKLYQHLITWQHLAEEDADLANRAMDYVINIKIVDADKGKGFVKFIEGGLLDERFRDMDTAKVFNILKQEKQQGGGNAGNSSQGGQQGQGNSQGQGQPLDAHGWDEAKGMSELRKKQLQRDLDSAVRQGSLLASKAGTGGDRSLDDLLQPQVDWREQLREFVQTMCTGNDYSTWRRPNRRYVGMNYYMPSGVSESMGELVVAVDTSGSIASRELQLFLSEVASVCEVAKPEKLRVLYWDTEVCREEVYEQDELQSVVKSTKPKGGGGTNVACVPEHLRVNNIKAQAVLVLTDGHLHGGWGQWDVPVMWCVANNKKATATVGKTIHIND